MINGVADFIAVPDAVACLKPSAPSRIAPQDDPVGTGGSGRTVHAVAFRHSASTPGTTLTRTVSIAALPALPAIRSVAIDRISPLPAVAPSSPYAARSTTMATIPTMTGAAKRDVIPRVGTVSTWTTIAGDRLIVRSPAIATTPPIRSVGV